MIDIHNIVGKVHTNINAETSSLQMNIDGVRLIRDTHGTSVCGSHGDRMNELFMMY